MFPADQTRASESKRPSTWADDVFQMATRRSHTLASALHPSRRARRPRGNGRLGPMLWRHGMSTPAGDAVLCRFVSTSIARTEAELLRELPGRLDHVERAWIEAECSTAEQLERRRFAVAPVRCPASPTGPTFAPTSPRPGRCR